MKGGINLFERFGHFSDWRFRLFCLYFFGVGAGGAKRQEYTEQA
jgi:hypothetical protein